MHSEHLHESASDVPAVLDSAGQLGCRFNHQVLCCMPAEQPLETACCKASVMCCTLLIKAWSLALEFDVHPKPDQCCQVLQVLWLLIEVYAECSEHLPESASEAPAVLDNTVQLGCSNLLGACACYHGR